MSSFSSAVSSCTSSDRTADQIAEVDLGIAGGFGQRDLAQAGVAQGLVSVRELQYAEARGEVAGSGFGEHLVARGGEHALEGCQRRSTLQNGLVAATNRQLCWGLQSERVGARSGGAGATGTDRALAVVDDRQRHGQANAEVDLARARAEATIDGKLHAGEHTPRGRADVGVCRA